MVDLHRLSVVHMCRTIEFSILIASFDCVQVQLQKNGEMNNNLIVHLIENGIKYIFGRLDTLISL